jgi:LytTr DNA-binding domain
MENIFKKPFGRVEPVKERIVFVLTFGLFIFLFLFLFKPFGLSQLKTMDQLFITAGFGLVTISMLFIFKFLIEPVVINEKWTFGKSLLWGLLIASSIGAANYFYISVIYPQIFVFKYFLVAIWTAILVGIIPAGIVYIVTFNRIYRSALREASIPPEKIYWESEVIISGGNPKNEFRYNPRNIIYLCSNDNYITVVEIKDEKIIKKHIRGTLKGAEWELRRNNSFVRCHKCYIVNSEYVDHITGNMQNLRIILKSSGIEIPVSRSKATSILMKFR